MFTPKTIKKTRGTVLLLVIAVLAILVIMGTAYIVSSRTERGSSRATIDATNTTLARDAILHRVQEIMWQQAPVTNLWTAGRSYSFGDQVRTSNSDRLIYTYVKTTPSTSSAVSELNNTSLWSASSNKYDFDYPLPGGWLDGSNNITQLSDYYFDPSTNNYTLSYDTTFQKADAIGDPNHIVANSFYNLLPSSAPNGVRYRYALRIIDTNSKANLNTGWPDNTPANLDSTGQYLGSVNLTNVVTTFPDTTPLNLQTAGLGRAGSTGINSRAAWNFQVLSIEKPAITGVSFFDIADEMELRAYGNTGTSTPSRLFSTIIAPNLWPSTLAASPATTYRSYYTAYSFDREMRRLVEPTTPYTCTESAPNDSSYNQVVWARYPTKVALNCALRTNATTVITSAGPANAAEVIFMANDLAPVATNVASAMKMAGYSDEKCLAAAANYLTYRYSGGYYKIISAASGVSAYTLPAGPSFIDDLGICIRGVDMSAAPIAPITSGTELAKLNYTGTLHAAAGTVYLGYSAQPFINEVMATMALQVPTPPATAQFDAPSNAAIELYNPYRIALCLDGFRLTSTSTAGTWTHTFGANDYIPALGYHVVSMASGLTIDSSAQTSTDGTIALNPAPDGGTIQLQRSYIDRTGTVQWVNIDTFDYVKLMDVSSLSAPLPATKYTLERRNTPSSGGPGLWLDAMVENVNDRTRTTTPTLGVKNTIAGNSPYSGEIMLSDRFAVSSPAVQGSQGANIADFAQVARICNVGGASGSAISTQLATILTTAPAVPFANMNATNLPGVGFPNMAYDAQVHFNFYYPLSYYDASPATVSWDEHAIKFLDYCAWVDRVYDPTLNLSMTKSGSPALELDRLRLAGRINVNTAPQQVLQTLPNMTAAKALQVIHFRDRDASTYPKATYGNGPAIHSTVELMKPLCDAAPFVPTQLSDLYSRSGWASLYTSSTTRSDTFVVYGVLEAIKKNPNASHDNAGDWYMTAVQQPASTDKNQLISRRRFMAIIDRSWCNYPRGDANFVLPRIVAYKELSN